ELYSSLPSSLDIYEVRNEGYKELKFRQSPWIKEYIEENIRKCKIAKANRDEFGVMYYKLKNNAVFGKQMENVCKYMRVELL
ncbi:1025_t:CDS:1, partial [Racocetra persica]